MKKEHQLARKRNDFLSNIEDRLYKIIDNRRKNIQEGNSNLDEVFHFLLNDTDNLLLTPSSPPSAIQSLQNSSDEEDEEEEERSSPVNLASTPRYSSNKTLLSPKFPISPQKIDEDEKDEFKNDHASVPINENDSLCKVPSKQLPSKESSINYMKIISRKMDEILALRFSNDMIRQEVNEYKEVKFFMCIFERDVS